MLQIEFVDLFAYLDNYVIRARSCFCHDCVQAGYGGGQDSIGGGGEKIGVDVFLTNRLHIIVVLRRLTQYKTCLTNHHDGMVLFFSVQSLSNTFIIVMKIRGEQR